MSGERILLVEDERAQREPLADFLRGLGHEVLALASAEEALDRFGTARSTILITDLRLPGMDGLELIRRLRALDEEAGILLITAYASVESAIEALRLGAHDYLLKPLLLDEVATKVERLREQRALRDENLRLRRALHLGEARGPDLVAESPAMREVLTWIQRAGGSRAHVLILGETGTGKEVVARAIHAAGEQAEEPFLPVNLGTLPEAMIESELFGHERGAFTGAEQRREGILRAAGRGAVFLDEVAELPLHLQPKLLRALEAHEVFPLGSDRPVPFEARVLAATHRDLDRMVQERQFREDLYYRLHILEIHLPPLRERREEIPTLVSRLLARSGPVPELDPALMPLLAAAPWPGNVRELANVLERAQVLVAGESIGPEHLPEDLREHGSLELQPAVERFERGHIALALRLAEGNRERAARSLGISPRPCTRRIEKLGLKGFALGPDAAEDPGP